MINNTSFESLKSHKIEAEHLKAEYIQNSLPKIENRKLKPEFNQNQKCGVRIKKSGNISGLENMNFKVVYNENWKYESRVKQDLTRVHGILKLEAAWCILLFSNLRNKMGFGNGKWDRGLEI